jgi:hypothetical protein
MHWRYLGMCATTCTGMGNEEMDGRRREFSVVRLTLSRRAGN